MSFNLFLAVMTVISYFPGKENVLQIGFSILFIKVLDPHLLPITTDVYMKIVRLSPEDCCCEFCVINGY